MATNKGLLSFIQRSSTIDGTDCGSGKILGGENKMATIDKKSDEFANMVQLFIEPWKTPAAEYDIDLNELFTEQSRKYTVDEAIWMLHSSNEYPHDTFSRDKNENYTKLCEALKNTLDKQEQSVVTLIIRAVTRAGLVINYSEFPWFKDIVDTHMMYYKAYSSLSSEEYADIIAKDV